MAAGPRRSVISSRPVRSSGRRSPVGAPSRARRTTRRTNAWRTRRWIRLEDVRDGLPKDFCELVHCALAVDPADRFADTRDMARCLGDVLKGHRVDEDLYALIARTVQSARTELGIGERTQDPALEGSIPEEQSGLVELLVEDEDKPTGFRRWIPKFLRGD